MKRDPLAAPPDAEPGALATLYRRWRQPLVRLLQGRFGSRADAEDATQQVFTQMAASGRLPTAGKEQAYLGSAARHLAIDHWRRRGRDEAIATVPLDADDEALAVPAADHAHDPALHAQHRQRLARLDAALHELPARQREAFTLNVLEGLTQEEVAARMGISLRMVSKHISRAYAYCELRLHYGSLEQMQRLRATDEPTP